MSWGAFVYCPVLGIREVFLYTRTPPCLLGKPSWELGDSYGSMGAHIGAWPQEAIMGAGMGACMGADMGAAPIPAPIHAPIPAPILFEQVWECEWEQLPFVLKRIPRFPTQAPVMVPKLQLGLLKGFSKPFKLFCCRLEALLEPLDGVLDTFD
jgi:hypothetical protein